MSTLENDTELNKKLEESFDEINIADTTDDVLELTFNELIEGINAKYFEFLNKLSEKFKDTKSYQNQSNLTFNIYKKNVRRILLLAW